MFVLLLWRGFWQMFYGKIPTMICLESYHKSYEKSNYWKENFTNMLLLD